MHHPPRRPLLFCLALAAGCSSTLSEPPSPHNPPEASAPSSPDRAPRSPFLGRHDLTLSPDSSWHRHALEITAVSDAVVEGVVTIDLGIGPEGRAPGPDEIVHQAAFKAPRGPDPHRLRLSVTIGDLDPTLVTLDLWACPEAGAVTCGQGGDGARLTGTATFESQRAGSSSLDALARPTRPGDK